MLRGSTHAWKVNFCKFTNETRLAMEDASANSGLRFVAVLNGIFRNELEKEFIDNFKLWKDAYDRQLKAEGKEPEPGGGTKAGLVQTSRRSR